MRPVTVLFTAVSGLARSPMRAMLTTLGIVIGIGAVIVMMEIGAGSAAAIRHSILSMGANQLQVRPGAASSGGVVFGSGSAPTLTAEDAEAIRRECPAVKNAAPVVRTRTQVIHGSRNWVPTYIYGTTPAFLEVRNWQVELGEMFTERDVLGANRVCLLGRTVVEELFGDESPLGKEIRIKNVRFRVAGVLAPKGANMVGIDQDDIVLAPWTAIKFRVSGESGSTSGREEECGEETNTRLYPGSGRPVYPERLASQQLSHPMREGKVTIDRIMVAAASTEEIGDAIDQITRLLRERHRIRPGEPDDFNIRNLTESVKALTSTSTLTTNLLLAVALISLVVGGVGIMNIMLVSVTERTREIGLRMAVGARPRDILAQFLLEALLLCLAGGILGIVLGHGSALLVRHLLRWPVEMAPGAIVVAVAVSAAVGITFGFYPAWKGSRLDPIEALRYE